MDVERSRERLPSDLSAYRIRTRNLESKYPTFLKRYTNIYVKLQLFFAATLFDNKSSVFSPSVSRISLQTSNRAERLQKLVTHLPDMIVNRLMECKKDPPALEKTNGVIVFADVSGVCQCVVCVSCSIKGYLVNCFPCLQMGVVQVRLRVPMPSSWAWYSPTCGILALPLLDLPV